MTRHDLIGAPLPTSHPLFSADKALLRKIKKLESLVELRHDFDELEDALNVLKWSLDYEKQGFLLKEFGSRKMLLIADMALSYMAVLYGKAFTESTGRTQLKGKEEAIFKELVSSHQGIMNLRHDFC